MALTVTATAAWCLALQVGPGAGAAFATSSPAPPIEDPFTPGQFINGTTGTLVTDGVETAAGADVGAEAGGSLCAVLGAGTLGASCVAGIVIASTCLIWKSGCSSAMSGIETAGKFLWHTVWGGSHTSITVGAAGSPGQTLTSGYSMQEVTCSWSGVTGSCMTLVVPSGTNYNNVAIWWHSSAASYEDNTLAGGRGCSWTTGGGGVTCTYFLRQPVNTVDAACLTNNTPGSYNVPTYAVWGGGIPHIAGNSGTPATSCPGQSNGGTTHRWTTVTHCSDGSTQTLQSSTFNDSDATPAAVPVPVCGGAGGNSKGVFPTSITSTDTPGSGGTALGPVTYTAPPEWTNPTDEQNWSTCDPGGSDVPCKLIWQVAVDENLQVDTTGDSTRWQECDTIAGLCADLTTYIAATPIATYPGYYAVKVLPVDHGAGTGRYRCMYGPYHVNAADCVNAGSPTDTTSTTDLTAGTTTPDSNDCFPHGWLTVFNPLWFYDPLKCIFIPDVTDLEASATKVQTALANSPMGTAATAVTDITGAISGLFGGSGDCHGPQLPAIPQVGLTVASYPLDACAPPLQTWAAFSRGLLTFLVYLGGGYVAVEWVASAFGWHLPWKRIAPWWEGAEQQELF